MADTDGEDKLHADEHGSVSIARARHQRCWLTPGLQAAGDSGHLRMTSWIGPLVPREGWSLRARALSMQTSTGSMSCTPMQVALQVLARASQVLRWAASKLHRSTTMSRPACRAAVQACSQSFLVPMVSCHCTNPHMRDHAAEGLSACFMSLPHCCSYETTDTWLTYVILSNTHAIWWHSFWRQSSPD